MLVKGKDVIGLSIVTIDTGSVIETIKDVAYNPTTQRIEALFVSKGGIFSAAKAIHINDVENIGEDAAIVENAAVIKSVKELPEVIGSISGSNKYLVSTKVLTINGKALGKVSDIVFNSETGYVDSMEVSQGGLKTLTEGKKSIKPIDIVTIGADTTIVSAYTELKLEAQGEQGGLKGAVNDAKDKAAELGANAREATQDIAGRAVEAGKDLGDASKRKSNEITESVREKSDEFTNTARRTTNQIADATTEAYEDARNETNKRAKKARRAINELADTATEKAHATKDIATDQIDSLRREDREVVATSKKTVEDATERVEVERTKIVRKK